MILPLTERKLRPSRALISFSESVDPPVFFSARPSACPATKPSPTKRSGSGKARSTAPIVGSFPCLYSSTYFDTSQSFTGLFCGRFQAYFIIPSYWGR